MVTSVVILVIFRVMNWHLERVKTPEVVEVDIKDSRKSLQHYTSVVVQFQG
jgi:hypothetical protein